MLLILSVSVDTGGKSAFNYLLVLAHQPARAAAGPVCRWPDPLGFHTVQTHARVNDTVVKFRTPVSPYLPDRPLRTF